VNRVRSLLLLVLVASVLLTGCQSDTAHLSNGQPTPPFQLRHLHQGDVQFPEEFLGKVVVIRFWADWCPFCEGEMQAIEPVYQTYRQQGLVILAVNVRQNRDTAAAFIDRLGITYDVLLDSEGETARDYGVIGLPTTFIINREGRLHTKIIGESTPQVLEQILSELL
jgi:cytochrome c biogenesis protein CcmG, thiol:disulfide interchange protein DsbE